MNITDLTSKFHVLNQQKLIQKGAKKNSIFESSRWRRNSTTSQGRHHPNNTKKNKGESVSGAEWRRVPASRSAAETNSLDRSSYQQKNPVICVVSALLSLHILQRGELMGHT